MKFCPLCQGESSLYFKDDRRKTIYNRCLECEIIFTLPEFHLSFEQELARYQTHKNDPKDPAYRSFLSQLTDPVSKRLQKNSYGLDYGSGPGPTIHLMMQEKGHQVENYDPFFSPEYQLTKALDFITCSETAEHFRNPVEEFSKISSLLKPGGILGLMTLLFTEETSFSNWYYRQDPTHLVFYTKKSIEKISSKFFTKVDIISDRVFIFQK